MSLTRFVPVVQTEVFKVMKLTGNSVVPVAFSVPRKTKSTFHDDLFPPTATLEPAMDAATYFGGENKVPVMGQMTGDKATNLFLGSGAAPAPVVVETKEEEKAPEPAKPQPKPSLGGRVFAAKPEPKAEPRVFKKVQVVRSTHFRHIFGKGTKKELRWEGLKPSTSANTSVVKANSKYFCLPWAGAGGRVAIVDIEKRGRLDDVPFMELGSDCLDFDWCPFDDNKLACVTENAQVQIWDIPESGPEPAMNTPSVALKGHMRRTQLVSWHPWASNVIASSSYDLSVRLWDVQTQEEKVCIAEGHDDHAMSMSWNYDGSLLATSSRDKQLRLIDPRAGKVVLKTMAHDGAKGFRATWLGNRQQIASVGHSRTSERMLNLWDVRNLSDGAKSLRSVSIDTGAGAVTPHFDEDINVLYLCGKGEGTVKMFEINDNQPFAHYLTSYTNPTPAQGMALMPKSSVNVRDVQIARWIKLESSGAEEISFRVPRTRMEFFQDDIYPDTRDHSGAALTAEAWFGGEQAEPQLTSLCPPDMDLLSLAPPEEKAKRVVEVAEEGIDADKMKELVIDAFGKKMTDHGEGASVLKQDMMEGTNDDEWDDY
jgi:coronin-7